MFTVESAEKGMDLGAKDADWMSLRNGLHLVVVELDSCSFTRLCNTFL